MNADLKAHIFHSIFDLQLAIITYFVMVIHTFGEYLDYHPHLHLLMADGLFLRDERFLVLPENGMDAVEELFRAKVITFLSKQGLLQPERARMQ